MCWFKNLKGDVMHNFFWIFSILFQAESQFHRILNNTSTDLILNCCNNHKLNKWLLNLL